MHCYSLDSLWGAIDLWCFHLTEAFCLFACFVFLTKLSQSIVHTSGTCWHSLYSLWALALYTCFAGVNFWQQLTHCLSMHSMSLCLSSYLSSSPNIFLLMSVLKDGHPVIRQKMMTQEFESLPKSSTFIRFQHLSLGLAWSMVLWTSREESLNFLSL